ncbi:MAG: hypothetical protein P1P89_13810 [Desulfobacterales bacterium]|nr:hypothetical protein [Desulfobacterales bacterium]
MSNIRFFWQNLFDLAALTASSQDADFPAANLQNPLRTKVYKTAGATPGTANLVIDHLTAKPVTAIILANYDWAGAPGTLNLEFNAADAWGAPSATEALTWVATPDTYGNPNVIIKVFASKSYRYNRLNVVYSPGAVPTDWQLGRIFLGTCFEPINHYDFDGEESIVDPSFIGESVGGQQLVDEITKYRTKSFDFPAETLAQWLLFQQMFNSVGYSRDLFVAFDFDNYPNALTMYGKFTSLRQQDDFFKRIELAFKESR